MKSIAFTFPKTIKPPSWNDTPLWIQVISQLSNQNCTHGAFCPPLTSIFSLSLSFYHFWSSLLTALQMQLMSFPVSAHPHLPLPLLAGCMLRRSRCGSFVWLAEETSTPILCQFPGSDLQNIGPTVCVGGLNKKQWSSDELSNKSNLTFIFSPLNLNSVFQWIRKAYFLLVLSA